jgi:integrase/recombinase XerD
MNSKKLLNELGVYLKAVGYQTQTQSALLKGIQEFLDWLEKPINKVERSDLQQYHDYLKTRPNKLYLGGLSSQSIQLAFWQLRVCFGYLEKQGSLEHNPAAAYKLGKVSHEVREILTKPQIELLYQQAHKLKERITLHLFYGLGLRRSEGERLNRGDLDGNRLYLRKTKQGGSRVMPLLPNIQADLQAYLATRTDQQAALILNSRARRMRGASYLKLLRKLLKKAKLPEGIDLHSLRHSIATHLVQSAMPLHQVQQYLGHRHIESTQNYLHYGHQDLSV